MMPVSQNKIIANGQIMKMESLTYALDVLISVHDGRGTTGRQARGQAFI